MARPIRVEYEGAVYHVTACATPLDVKCKSPDSLDGCYHPCEPLNLDYLRLQSEGKTAEAEAKRISRH